MAIYQYRCDQDGVLETTRPIGSAPDEFSCPACGELARRVISVPRLALADRRVVALIDSTERTREEPDVVTALPGRRGGARQPVRASPALQRLPRP